MNMTTGEIPAANAINAATEQAASHGRMPLWQRVGAGATAVVALNGINMLHEVATADPAEAVVSTHDGWFRYPVDDINHQLEHIRSDKKPNFLEVRACAKPAETTPANDVRTLAAFCLKYGTKGPDGKGSDVAILDLTKKSTKFLRKASKSMEDHIAKETNGNFTVDTTIIKPTAKAKQAITALAMRNGNGCIVSTVQDGMIAKEARKVMPKLSKYPTVLAVTDFKSCASAAVADEKSNIDVYSANSTTVPMLSGIFEHEYGHNNLNLNHYGFVGPADQPFFEATNKIPAKYINNGLLNIAAYQEQSEYRVYDPNCSNIMGQACGKEDYIVGRPPATLNAFQKDEAYWAFDAMGMSVDTGLRTITDEGIELRANDTQSGNTGIVTLDNAIGMGQVNGTDYRRRVVEVNNMTVIPIKQKIKGTKMYNYTGFQLEGVNTETTVDISFGRVNLEVGQSIRVQLPGVTGQTIVVSRGASDTMTLRTEITESIDEGNW